MSPRPYFFFAAFLACASAGYAVRPVPATPAPKADTAAKPVVPKSNEPVPPYVLKNRSTFANVNDSTRVPFWPIGWTKKAKNSAVVQAPVEEAPKFTLDSKSFRLTSILVASGSTPSLAVINGRAYGEGEIVRMPHAAGTAPLRVRVQRISDTGVVLAYANQTVIVPLQHPDLGPRKPEELLEDKDR